MQEQTDYYVYLHKRPDGSVFYVGKGKDRRAWDKQNRNQHWHNIVNKHNGYDVEIIKSGLTEQESLDLEIKTIEEFGIENLSNIILGGSGVSGLVHSEDTRKRMSKSHKQRYAENPQELQNKLDVLAKIHEKMRNDPETKRNISERNSAWWKNADQETLDRLSELRSHNSKSMWQDEEKRKELSEAIKKSFERMHEDVKKERQRKLSEASKAYFANITEEQRKEMADRAKRTLHSEESIAKYKEAHLRKIVLNRSFIVESRAEFARLLGTNGVFIKTLEASDYDIRAGFFIENFDPLKHENATEIKTLKGIQRIYPENRGCRPVKNSKGEIFLSLKEAGDSLLNSNGSDQTKQGSITESCRLGIKAYGLFWSKPTEAEIETEVMKRLASFLEKVGNNNDK